MSTIFMSIPDTARHTGLAECFIRKGIKAGNIPTIKSGKKYLVNVPLMLERLNAQSGGIDGKEA